MQRLIACARDGFAFGDPDKTVLKKYASLTPEDCVPLEQVREKVNDPIYGHRYKLLVDGIDAVVSDLFIISRDLENRRVALVVLPRGPLFAALLLFNYDRGFDNPDPLDINLQFYLPYRNDQQLPLWPAIGPGIEIPTDLSQSRLALARGWLEDCTSRSGKHAICGPSDDAPLMPTRVIDLGSHSAKARLHLSRPGEKGHWVALSQCWGTVQPIKTTTLTLDTFVEELPSELPKTFADAIYVTRTLGQRYLWIDSLCIVQDSAEDWVSEASRMDLVYSQALFTIAADAAEDSTSGFLQPPARQISKSKVILCDLNANSAELKAGCAGIVHVRRRGDLAYQLPYHGFTTHYDYPRDDAYKPYKEWIYVPHSRLSTRAWAFQERLLSPRTLHFSSTETAWECRALCTCECSATNERTGLTKSLLKGSHALQSSDAGGETEKENIWIVDNAWQRDIVEEYTQLNLTVGTDRLSALAGLAARTLTLRPGDQYIAGLWRNTLAAGLSWYTVNQDDSLRLPASNASGIWSHIPTWSWASVSGQVKHARLANFPVGSPLTKILQIQYEAMPKYPMASGPQRPASLLVWGHVVPIERLWEQQYMKKEEKWVFTPCYRVQWPSNVNLSPYCIAMIDVQKEPPAFNDRVHLDRLDDTLNTPKQAFVLLTAIAKEEIFGIVLKRHTGSPAGAVPAYRRVGFVNGSRDLQNGWVPWISSDGSDRIWVSEPRWLDGEYEGLKIGPLLGGIGKSMVKIY